MAEAYNPSGSAAPVQVQGVKPWLIPNCDPTRMADRRLRAGRSLCGHDHGSDSEQRLVRRENHHPDPCHRCWDAHCQRSSAGTLDYYRADVPIRPPEPVCPSTSAVGCAQVGSDDYHDNIACTSTFQFSCGQTIGAGPGGDSAGRRRLGVLTNEGTQCLIHASGQGPTLGQDELLPERWHSRWHRSHHHYRAATIIRIRSCKASPVSAAATRLLRCRFTTVPERRQSLPGGLHPDRDDCRFLAAGNSRKMLRVDPTDRSKV